MLTKEEVEDLLLEPKVSERESIDLSLTKETIKLYSKNDDKLQFKLQITQSCKIQLKFTNHHSFNNIGLLRLDYKGRHKNPEEIIHGNHPYDLNKYAGKVFDINEPHMHIYIENFDLRWALPLNEYNFNIKTISSRDDIIKAIKNFQKKIALETNFKFQLPII